MKIKARYTLNKKSPIKTECICPSCNTKFIKTNYQQAFCRTKEGTICKDKYWYTVTPTKRNNTTRISPASAYWLEQQAARRERDYNPDNYEHLFSSYALGQD